MDSKRLLREALALPEEARVALAGELIDSLDGEVEQDAEAAWAHEIRARVSEVESGQARRVSWSEARRRIEAASGRGPHA
ncbi:MAG: addiction module protein [Vicinamibacterales bacterium]